MSNDINGIYGDACRTAPNLDLTLDEVREYARSGVYDILPLSCEILSDVKTPIEAMRNLMSVSGHCFMLESAGDNENWGRYTFLGCEPEFVVTCLNGDVKLNQKLIPEYNNNPAGFIRKILSEHKSPARPELPPFTGGLVGYFAYDYLKYSEPSLNLDTKDSDGFNDVDLMLFDKVIAFDNFRQKIIFIVNINLKAKNLSAEYERAGYELAGLESLVRGMISAKKLKDFSGRMTSELKTLFSRDEYCEMVKKAKRHIIEGDIFQLVLSNRLEADFEGSLFNTYRILRTLNPSPYMFYFSGSDMEAAGASPETLVKLHNGVLHTFPLAGTRPRGRTPQEDSELERELLNDPKELAEHNMLVDLGRNDIGKISKFGSVKVEKFHEILKFSHVMHIGSTVKGEIRDDHDQLDAVDAILPAGTLSGAPKIMACKLINDIENDKRGIYGGAIGYLDFTGNLDLCIAIRIAYKKNGKVFIRNGAGIVADSEPEKEFSECANKAKAVALALKAAENI